MEDIIIIGGGIIGASIARELSRYKLSIVLIEKEEDVACGTTKANSAIIHAGYDADLGKLKGKLNVKGNALCFQICDELNVPVKRTGSLIVATEEKEIEILKGLLQRGRSNGIAGLRILKRDELLKMEKNLTPDAQAALYAPTAGVACPYELTVALAENAIENGVKIILSSPVTDVILENDEVKGIKTIDRTIQGKFIINAAGVFADEINKMAGGEEYTIKPRKGEYNILDKRVSNLVSKILFPMPTKITKGVLVIPTTGGNILIGPNANDIEDKNDLATTKEGLEEILMNARKLVPGLSSKDVITSFAGLRAVSDTDDFIIEASRKVKGFINVGGIQSPGLSSAPAIALMVSEILREEGLKLTPKTDFDPVKKRKIRFSDLDYPARKRIISKNALYGQVVCRCETVTEGEIVDAVRTPLEVKSLDSIKRRTRAGMGRCQGGFCSPRVISILAKELGLSPDDITKCGGESKILTGRIKEIFFRSREGSKNG